jgi:tetratricopeptide (TPR) repeat protein
VRQKISRGLGGVLLLLLAACGPPAHVPLDPQAAEPDAPEELTLVTREAARVAYAEGLYRREQGDAQGALDAFALAVRLEPDDPNLRLGLARHLVDVGSVREAESLLEKSVRRGNASPQERVLLAQLRMLAGRKEDALREVDAAIAADSTQVLAWLLRGRVLFELERFPAAEQSYIVADSLQPNRPTTLLHLGECRAKRGDDAAAEKAYLRALQLNPDLLAARSALADLYQHSGRVDAAIQLYRQALEADPADAQATDALVELYVEEKQYDAGVTLLQSRPELEPRQRYLLGWMLLQLQRPDDADAALQPLANSGLGGVESLMGEIAVRRKRYDEAEQHFRHAVAARPEECDARVRLAAVVLEKWHDAKERGEADTGMADSLRVLLAQAAARTAADDARCNLLLGIAYSQLRDFENAVRHLEASYQLEPQNTEVLFNLAMAHQELGHFDTALRYGRTVLEREPENAAALNFVGYILAEHGLELEDSEALIRRALTVEPENGYYVDSLGWVLYRRGEYQRAVTELERAVALTGNHDAIILEHLGDACVKAGQLDGAHRAYVQSRALDPDNRGLQEKIQNLEAKLGRP